MTGGYNLRPRPPVVRVWRAGRPPEDTGHSFRGYAMRFHGLAAVALVLAMSAVRADDKPEVTYKQDGADVVVSVKARANNSPHALIATTEGSDKALTLRYVLVQNPDIFVRSMKWVTVEWRLVGKKEEDVKVKGVERVELNVKTADLKAFADQVQKVVEAGEKKEK